MSQQRASPPGPLFSAAKCNECWIRIAHDFHGNGLTGREKRNHVQLFMLCQGTLHLYEACFEPIDKLFSAGNDSSRPLGSIEGTLIWGRSLRKLIS